MTGSIRIAYLVSSARHLTLADGRTYPAGLLSPDEVLKSYERLASAGVEIRVITPTAGSPSVAPHSWSWFFNTPDVDSRYLASVVATFARHAEDFRLTLDQHSRLGLTASRRLAVLLQDQGRTADQAHRLVSAAAKIAWERDVPLVDVLADDGSHGLTLEQLGAASASLHAESQELGELQQSRLEARVGRGPAVVLSSLTTSDIDRYDGLFVAGGYGALTDLSDNPDVGRLLLALHQRRVPIAALGHGAAALLSAPEQADGLWLFEGYRLASITDEEEDQTDAGRHGMAWRLDVALKNAGAIFDDGPAAWVSHVVVDRNLITGQNPASADATAGAMLKQLGVTTSSPGPTPRSPRPDHIPPTQTRTPTEVVKAFLESLTNRSVDAAMSLVDAEAFVTVHPLSVKLARPESLERVLSDLVLGFPDLQVGVDRIISTDDVVTALLKVGGTQSADYAGAINLNRHVNIDQAWRFVVSDSVITAITVYWCQAQLYRRLSVKRYDEIAIA